MRLNLIRPMAYIKNLLFICYANIFKNCAISSIQVSPTALKGTNIHISRGSHVDATSEIGANSYIGQNNFITRSKIGRYTSIANNVSIGQGEHNTSRISTSSIFYQSPWNELTTENCVIGNDVWIGVDAIVLRGVEVGTGSVIGANAVVTKNVPDFAVVAGVPARILRYRFPELQQEAILNSKWWDFEPTEAAEIIARLEKEFKKA